MCEKKCVMYYSFATFEHLIVMRAVTFVLIDADENPIKPSRQLRSLTSTTPNKKPQLSIISACRP
jgi:hypothetical protein